MGGRVQVCVQGSDPISQAGVVAQLRGRPEVNLTDDADGADVVVIVSDEVDDATARTVRAIQRGGVSRAVLVVGLLDDAGLMRAVEAGVSGVVRRREATPERMAVTVQAAAAGEGSLAPDLLGRLMSQLGQLQRQVLSPRGIGPSGLTGRELEVLRLLADGHDTGEIARTLAYSERTIKNIIHDVTSRLNLRNRSHAVAFAAKAGLI